MTKQLDTKTIKDALGTGSREISDALHELRRCGTGEEVSSMESKLEEIETAEDQLTGAESLIAVSDMECDTLLAALRYFQHGLKNGGVPEEIMNIADNEGAHEGLDIKNIDAMCEEINCSVEVSTPSPKS